jgi:hypothetical protein
VTWSTRITFQMTWQRMSLLTDVHRHLPHDPDEP